MKKLIALTLSVLMMLGLLAGCGGGKDTDSGKGNTPATEGTSAVNIEKTGSLVLTANACMEISYGTDGVVLGVEGLNDEGKNLIESSDELLGASCAEVVNKLIKECSIKTYQGSLSYVAVKFNKDAGTPDAEFLSGIETAAKAALETVAPNAKLVIITPDKLDADGYIDLATAQLLVEGYLEVDKLDGFDGTDKPVDGFYSFKVSFNGIEDEVHVNASTGVVGDGALSGTEEEEIEEETTPEESTPDESEPAAPESEDVPEETQSAEAPVE